MTFRQGVVSSYYDDEDDEETAIVHFRDSRRGTMLGLFDVSTPLRFKFSED